MKANKISVVLLEAEASVMLVEAKEFSSIPLKTEAVMVPVEAREVLVVPLEAKVVTMEVREVVEVVMGSLDAKVRRSLRPPLLPYSWGVRDRLMRLARVRSHGPSLGSREDSSLG